jgi:hypothetical protein
MQQDERLDRDHSTIRNALEGWQRKMWTASPAIVQPGANGSSVVGEDGTISCVLAIKGRVRAPDGTESDQEITPLVKVPLACFGGGGFSVTAPVKAGDEVMVIFSSRCIDGWWQSGGVQSQTELRMHSLSDGMAIPGLRSAPNALANYDADAFQIRSDDGTTFFELAPGGVINATAPGGFNLTGNLNVTGEVTALSGTAGSVGLATHLTTDVQGGTGTSGAPKPGS